MTSGFWTGIVLKQWALKLANGIASVTLMLRASHYPRQCFVMLTYYVIEYIFCKPYLFVCA